METRTSPQARDSRKKRLRGTTRRKWLLGLACLALGGGWAKAAESAMGEYQVKAVYLFNFTKYTDWPTAAFASPDAPIVIGIVGEDPFGSTIDDVVKDAVVHERKLTVKRFQADDDLQGCHVLFISRSEKDRLPALVTKLKGHPVLSVGDINDFAPKGGMVGMVLAKDGTVKLEINQAAAEKARLQISAKLLKLAARIVNN